MPAPISVTNPSAQLTGKTLATLEDEQDVAGLKRFNRSPNAPFEVLPGSANVPNLDADMLDGQQGTDYHDAGQLNAGTIPAARFPAVLPAVDGSHLVNLDATHLTGVIPGTAVPDPLPAVSGAALTALPNPLPAVSGAALTALPNPLPAVSGAALTSLNAAALASGTVPDARMPAYLRTLLNVPPADGTGNTGAGETDISSWTIPAALLAAVGQGFRIRCGILLASNTNTKTVRLDVNGNKFALLTSSANVATNRGTIDVLVTRSSATLVAVTGLVTQDVTTGAPVTPKHLVAVGLTCADLGAGAQTGKITAQGGAGGDVTFYGLSVELVA